MGSDDRRNSKETCERKKKKRGNGLLARGSTILGKKCFCIKEQAKKVCASSSLHVGGSFYVLKGNSDIDFEEGGTKGGQEGDL